MYTVCEDLTTHHGHKVEECRKSWFERQFLIVALGTEIRVPLGGKIGALARDYFMVKHGLILVRTDDLTDGEQTTDGRWMDIDNESSDLYSQFSILNPC